MSNWKEVQPGSVWHRRLTPQMLEPEGDTIEMICKLIGEKGNKKIRQVVFDREYAYAMLDRFFQNLSPEQSVQLVMDWMNEKDPSNKD